MKGFEKYYMSATIRVEHTLIAFTCYYFYLNTLYSVMLHYNCQFFMFIKMKTKYYECQKSFLAKSIDYNEHCWSGFDDFVYMFKQINPWFKWFLQQFSFSLHDQPVRTAYNCEFFLYLQSVRFNQKSKNILLHLKPTNLWKLTHVDVIRKRFSNFYRL